MGIREEPPCINDRSCISKVTKAVYLEQNINHTCVTSGEEYGKNRRANKGIDCLPCQRHGASQYQPRDPQLPKLDEEYIPRQMRENIVAKTKIP